jgi:ribosome-associated toxin RatA of RatAB toxin-antitoxin module
MRRVEIELPVTGHDPTAVYTALCAFERFPEHVAALRSVRVAHSGDGRLWSSWELLVRGGVLRWTEQDRFDRRGLAIRFRQTGGEMAHFGGAWRVAATPNGCVVRFVADFALEGAALSGLLEPIVERALRCAVHAVVRGLFGPAAQRSRARRPRTARREQVVPLAQPAAGEGAARRRVTR